MRNAPANKLSWPPKKARKPRPRKPAVKRQLTTIKIHSRSEVTSYLYNTRCADASMSINNYINNRTHTLEVKINPNLLLFIFNSALLTARASQEPTFSTFTVDQLTHLFLQGKLNLNPVSQRPLVFTREFMDTLILTILKTKVRPPSILLNKVGENYDVYDGKQRVVCMLMAMLGMVCVTDPTDKENRAFVMSKNKSGGFVSIMKSKARSPVVKEFIQAMIDHMAPDEDTMPGDKKTQTPECCSCTP